MAIALFVGLRLPALAHGSEYVYARLILGDHPRLEVSLEYNDNPIVDSREQARSILERELLVRSSGQEANLATLAASTAWGESATFPQSAPVPVPGPGDGLDHRLVTVSIELSGPIQLSLLAGSEQAVIYWIEEDGSQEGPPRWKILLAGDTSPEVVLP